MGIQLSGQADSFGKRVREQMQPTSQRQLEKELLALKLQLSNIKIQIAQARADRAEVGNEATQKLVKELQAQYKDTMVELEEKQTKLDKIYREQLQPETKERAAASRKAEERYDTVDISAAASEAEGNEPAEAAEEAAPEETPEALEYDTQAELIKLAKELEEAERLGG